MHAVKQPGVLLGQVERPILQALNKALHCHVAARRRQIRQNFVWRPALQSMLWHLCYPVLPPGAPPMG